MRLTNDLSHLGLSKKGLQFHTLEDTIGQNLLLVLLHNSVHNFSIPCITNDIEKEPGNLEHGNSQ